MTEHIEQLVTEKPNPNTQRLDELSPLEIVQIMNEEDQKVALAVNKELPKIAQAIEIIVKQLNV